MAVHKISTSVPPNQARDHRAAYRRRQAAALEAGFPSYHAFRIAQGWGNGHGGPKRPNSRRAAA